MKAMTPPSPTASGKRSKGFGVPPQKPKRWRFLSILFLAIACAAILSAVPGLRHSARGTHARQWLPALFGPLRFEALELGDVLAEGIQEGTGDVASPLASTAVCLVGGARDFEATGPSILQRLLPVYQPCDVFVHAPLDKDAAKLWVLAAAPSVVAVRVFGNTDVDEAQHPSHILRAGGSPNAIQGLLQYFRLVEGCVGLIEQQEVRRGAPYEWVVRARLDSFWSRPAPPLRAFNRSAYTIPFGSDNGGLNDRFGVGGRDASMVALRRLSLLRDMSHRKDTRDLNSEMAYRLQFDLGGVAVERVHAPFCVLSRRLPDNLRGPCTPPMVSMASPAVLDGSKCFPCAPCGGTPERALLTRLYRAMRLPEVNGNFVGASDVVVCNYSGAWQEGLWQQRFDAVAGPALASAREEVAGASLRTCVARMDELRKKTALWDAPPPDALCIRGFLGTPSRVGWGKAAYNTLLRPVNGLSNVLTVDLSGQADTSWAQHLVQLRPGARVVRFKSLRDFVARMEPFAPALPSAIALPRVDLLKVNARVLTDIQTLYKLLLVRRRGDAVGLGTSIPICQLLLPLPSQRHGPRQQPAFWKALAFDDFLRPLSRLGYQLESCRGGQKGAQYHCLFFNPSQCGA